MDTLRQSEYTASEVKRHRALDCGRWVQCLGDPQRNSSIADHFLGRFPGAPNRDAVVRWAQKAAVGSAPSAWGSELMSPPMLTSAILDLSRPLTLLDRLVTAGARKVPINTKVPAVITGVGNFIWVGHGRAKPLSAGAFDSLEIAPAAVAGIVAASNELFRFAPGSTEALVDLLTVGAADFLNAQFVNPANGGSTDPFSPAALTNGVTPAASSTGDVQADLRTLLAAYVTAGGAMSSAVILISSTNAAALATRNGAGTGPVFPNLTVSGGTLAGCPAFASDALDDQLVILDVRRLLVADPNELDVSMSRHTALEMNSVPTADGGAGVGAVLVSLWQNDMTGIRVERRVSWGYSGAIAVITGVNYLGEPA